MKPNLTSRPTNDWSDIRARLEAKLGKLRSRTQRTDRDLRRAHGRAMHEQIVERQNDEVLEQLNEEGRDEIAAISDALARIDEGSYGRGTTGERPVGVARLRLLLFS